MAGPTAFMIFIFVLTGFLLFWEPQKPSGKSTRPKDDSPDHERSPTNKK